MARDEQLVRRIKMGNARLPRKRLEARQRAEDIARATLAEVSTFSDPAMRLVVAQRVIELREDLRDVQAAAVRDLLGRGWSYRAIASLLGFAKSWPFSMARREVT